MSENIYRSGSYVAGKEFGRLAGLWSFSEVPWGLDSDLSNSCTERIGLGTDSPIVRFSFPKYYRLLMVSSSTSAPIKLTEDEVKRLPKSLGDALLRVVLAVNSLGEGEQKELLKTLKPDVGQTQ